MKTEARFRWVWVVFLMGVLFLAACLLVPVSAQSGPSRAFLALSNAKQVSNALSAYCSDNNRLPDLSDPRKVVLAVRSVSRWHERKVSTESDAHVIAGTYIYNTSLSGRVPDDLANSDAVWLFHDSKTYEKGASVICYADGRCKKIMPDKLVEAMKVQPEWRKALEEPTSSPTPSPAAR